MSEQNAASKETCTVAVRFARDAHLMLIHDVSTYGFYADSDSVAIVRKNDCELYFSMANLLYIGCADALGDLPPQKEGNEHESR